MLERGSASTVALVQFEPGSLPVATMEISTQKSPLQATAMEIPMRKSPIQSADALAWETDVWIAENPDHMIYLNGDKFFGPREG